MRATLDPFLPGLDGSPEFQTRLEQAAAADGSPRTRHLRPDGRPRFVNRLAFETSPYLRQHAHNPVNWYPWSDEAFARAEAEHKPVLLSVGYSTCHWCHVMEHESFEDEEIAEVLNRHFVAIKVDREERPDVDEVYMSVVQALTGRGGWPMTVIMNAAREPFLGGTYFPARDGDRPGSRGFLPLLELVVRTRATKPEDIERSARAIAEAITNFAASAPPQDGPDPKLARAPAKWLLSQFDPVWGGFGGAPKFPRPVTLDYLFRHTASTGDDRAAEAALQTLDRMTVGGLQDHVGGGFHRYSVDDRWLIPHFEKMLYDNAQIVCALLDAQQWSGETRYGEVARTTLDYLLAEMQAERGGFYSATDADSIDPTRGEREEGWFFTWTEAEIDGALTLEQASAAKAWFGTSPLGNFEGRNQLHTPRLRVEVARELGVSEAELAERIRGARARLYAVRSTRPPPLRDDKVLASWNGLALSAFARAAFVLDEPRYREAAERTAAFLLTAMRDDDGRMLRVHAPGRPPQRGFLDDHAFVVQGLLDLFEATSDPRALDEARAIQAVLDEHYRDPETGAYFTTPDDGERLLVRVRPEYDGAEPSGNSVTAQNLVRLAAYGDDEALRRRAAGIFAAQAEALERHPHALPKLASALELHHARILEVFIVAQSRSDAAPFAQVLRTRFLPHKIVVIVSEDAVPAVSARVPGLAGKHTLAGRATAYVCERGTCLRPTTDPVEFATELS